MKNVFLVLSLFCLSFLQAQNFTVSGVVRDANTNEPLPGVSVVVKGTQRGVSADFDGLFSIEDLKDTDVLIFAYLGYRDQELKVYGDLEVEISMQEDVAALDEVVVVGYGVQRKKELTGAVAVVGEAQIEELNPTRLEQAIQGQVAGVDITSQSGSPGSGLNIRIRGITTNGDNRPLILVDGNVIEDLSVLNPSDIQSMNILKDATAGIYGVRAANGVILITTKTGRKNTKLNISLDSYAGIQNTTRKIGVLNGFEYAYLLNEAYIADGQAPAFTDFSAIGTGTDWQDEVFEFAPTHNYALTASGGTEKSAYSSGLSYLDQQGIVGLDKSSFQRITARINYQYDILENLKFTANTIYTESDRRGLPESGLGSVLFNAVNNSPLLSVFDQSGQYTLSEGLGNEVVNPLAQIDNTFNLTEVKRISGKTGLQYNLGDHITAVANAQFNYAEVYGNNFSPLVFYGSGKVFNNTSRISLTQSKDIFRDYTIDAFVNYKKLFSDHELQFTLGTSIFATRGQFSGGNQGFFNATDVTFENADLANADELRNALVESGLSGRFDERLLSYFARVQYNYKERLLFSGVIRRDGSTKFGPNNRFGYFPSLSLGYILKSDSSFKATDLVSFAKIRASYGILGNDRIAGNAFRAILNGEGAYVLGNTLQFGQAIGVLPNPEIQWEEQETLNVGADFKFFNNSLDLTFDYFIKQTSGLLLQPPVSGILGATGPGAQPPVVNAGIIENSGFEFVLGYQFFDNDDFSLSANANATVLTNDVISVNNGVGFLQGGSFGVGLEPPSRMEAGFPIGYFFGLKTDGIFQNTQELEAHADQLNASVGDLRYVDLNEDGIIDSNDRTYIGDPIPEFTAGFNLNMTYKQFDLSAYAFASVGNEMVRNYERNQPLVNKSVYAINRWTGEGSSTTDPRLTVGASSNALFSDYFVEDASFLRLQNAQIGYSFKPETLDKLGLTKLRLYLSGNNLFTFTKYRGFDPSASSGAPIGGGIDFGFYPVPRTVLLGLNLKM